LKSLPKKTGEPASIMVDRSTAQTVGWEDNITMHTMIKNLSAKGCNLPEIASLLGVRLGTLKQQLLRVPTLQEALVQGRDEATQRMVAAMFKAAVGGNIYQKIVEKIDYKGRKHTTVITCEAPPNPTLMIFWLTNRDKDNWSHVRQILKESTVKHTYGDASESSKIARLSRDILECDSADAGGEYQVQEETARPSGEGTGVSDDLPDDVSAEAADCVQDDAVDLPAETGTEPV
jgi:hypothetical protein